MNTGEKIRTYRRNCKLTQKNQAKKLVFPIKRFLVGKILVQCQTLKCCHFYIILQVCRLIFLLLNQLPNQQNQHCQMNLLLTRNLIHQNNPSHSKRHYLSFCSSFVWSIFFLSIINTKMKRSIDSILFETTNRLYHTPCRIRGQFHRTLGM